MKSFLQQNFEKYFNETPTDFFFSPGRVNLIGEHVDYNGGFVFPCALSFGTYGACRQRTDSKIRFFSENFISVGMVEVDLNTLIYDKKDDWTNYAKGVLKMIQEEGYETPFGMDLYVFGNIPNGAGLSSSASLELLMGVIADDYYHLDIDRIQLVKLCQKAENQFIGVNCGIMDQFAIGMGKEKMAIMLNTNTLEYTYVPLELKNCKIVIANTNKKRGLADSKYNERRLECEAALVEIQKHQEIHYLCDLKLESFEEVKHYINNPIHQKRAKHAVSENSRTQDALKALENQDLKQFGQLMNASHISLRDDYEVTGIELDTLVACAWEEVGIIGSRMTGAGFGGCTVSLVEEAHVTTFIKNVTSKYADQIGYEPSFYIATVGNGAGRME